MTRFLLLIFAIGLCISPVFAGEIYVSPAGDDTNPGTKAAPFLTLRQARDSVRALESPKENVTVFLREGEYSFASSLQMNHSDSGNEKSTVTWKAYPGETVVFTGGKSLTKFTPVSDPKIQQRLKPPCRNLVKQIDLRSIGIEEYGSITPANSKRMDLFFDSQFMPMARYPNEGWIHIGNVPQDEGKPIVEGIGWRKPGNVPAGRHYGRFHYTEDIPSQWAESDDIWIQGFFTWDWSFDFLRVEKLDRENKLVYPAKPHHHYGYTQEQRYAFFNVLEELDMPGEWCIDRAAGILYFYPPSKITPDNTRLSVCSEPLIQLKDTSHIRFEGIDFRVSRGRAAESSGGDSIVITDCRFSNFGDFPVVFENAKNSVVRDCEIVEVGRGGISMDGGNRKTLEPGNCAVVNNHIHQFSRILKTYQSAVAISGVGNRIAHNEIHGAPHMAVGWQGNEHVIEYNEIYDVLLETNDAGAIYSGRDPSMQGNIIRYNYFHDLDKGPHGHGVAAVYFDDSHCGNTVFGNVFYKAGRPGNAPFAAVFIHGGRYNVIENNIFVDCLQCYGETPWSDDYYKKIYKEHGWHKRLYENVDISKPPYSTKYPWLKDVTTDRRPNIFSNNLVVQCKETIGGKGKPRAEGNWVTNDKPGFTEDDPGFKDKRNQIFSLLKDSKAYKNIPDFKEIPFEKIGLID